MDVKTFEIAQDRQQLSTICELIHSSVGVREVFAATGHKFLLVATCGCTFQHSKDLTRHQRFCGR